MSLSADFRTFLLAQPAIAAIVGTSVHVRAVPQPIDPPYVWIARAGSNQDERTLDQAQGQQPWEERWDLEAISDDPVELEDLAAAVRGLDCVKGTFGAGSIQLLIVEDQTDDYVPKAVESDQGLDLAAFQLTIYGYEAGAESSSSA
jgi:hypothetical protein